MKEMLIYWEEFIQWWNSTMYNRDDLSIATPTFADFMEWLKTNIK